MKSNKMHKICGDFFSVSNWLLKGKIVKKTRKTAINQMQTNSCIRSTEKKWLLCALSVDFFNRIPR